MNYAALKCALHDDKFNDFVFYLNKINRFSCEEDEIFAHAAFFGKIKYVKVLLSSNKMFDEIKSCKNIIPVCLMRKNYNTFCVVIDRLLETNYQESDIRWKIAHYFKEYPNDYSSIEYLYNSPYKNIIDISELVKYNFLRNIIINLLSFLNNRDKNVYLIEEIVITYPILKEFTHYQIVSLISKYLN